MINMYNNIDDLIKSFEYNYSSISVGFSIDKNGNYEFIKIFMHLKTKNGDTYGNILKDEKNIFDFITQNNKSFNLSNSDFLLKHLHKFEPSYFRYEPFLSNELTIMWIGILLDSVLDIKKIFFNERRFLLLEKSLESFIARTNKTHCI